MALTRTASWLLFQVVLVWLFGKNQQIRSLGTHDAKWVLSQVLVWVCGMRENHLALTRAARRFLLQIVLQYYNSVS